MGFLLRTIERVRNSRGKRTISVRATEVLLYMSVNEACNCSVRGFIGVLVELTIVSK